MGIKNINENGEEENVLSKLSNKWEWIANIGLNHFLHWRLDLHLFIKGDFAFSRCLTKWNCISLKKFLHQDIGTFTLAQMRRVTNTNLLIWIKKTYQILMENLPFEEMFYFIKSPTKCKISISFLDRADTIGGLNLIYRRIPNFRRDIMCNDCLIRLRLDRECSE